IMAEEGRIPCQQFGDQWRFHRAAVTRWLHETNFGTPTWNKLIPKPSLARLSTHNPAQDSTSAVAFLECLRASGLLPEDQLRALLESIPPEEADQPAERLALKLASNGTLTNYQASILLGGTTAGLEYGSYQVLERIGAGGMSTVLKARHKAS